MAQHLNSLNLYRYLYLQQLILGLLVALVGYGWTIGGVVRAQDDRLVSAQTTAEIEVKITQCWASDWGARCLMQVAGDRKQWYLQWPSDTALPEVGERGIISATLKPWTASVFPGAETFGWWLLRQRVAAGGEVVSYQPLAPNLWESAVQRIRLWLRDRGLPAPADGIYQALVLGDRTALAPDLRGRVTRTQTQHLLALSGLHIGTLGLWVYVLSGLVWRAKPILVRQDWQKILALLSAGMLLIVAMPAVSLSRAFLMTLLPGLALVLRRYWTLHQSLLLIAVTMVLVDPLIWLDLGAWFSWTATLVLVLLVRQIGHWPSWRQALLIQLVLSLTLVPIYAFWQLPLFPLGSILNLMLIPWVTLVALPAAFLTALKVPLAGDAFVMAVWIWDGLLRLFDQGWGLFMAVSPLQALVILLCCGFGLLVRFRVSQWTLLGAVMGLLHWHNGQPPALQDGEFDVWVLDTGQAQSLVIETAAGRVLYDTGFGDPAAVHLQQPPLRWHWRWQALGGTSPWHAVVISHRDRDHAGGLASVAFAITPERLFASQPLDYQPDAWPVAQFCDLGTGFSLAGVAFRFERPIARYMPVTSNDQSCVLAIRSPSGSVLIPGDVGKRVEYGLLQNQRIKPVDLLVSGHHGSDTSSSSAFLRALSPSWVVHSAAAGRRPTRPDRRVVQRVTAAGAENHCTCWSGTLRYRFRKDEIIHEAYGNRLLAWLRIDGRAYPVLDS